MTTWIALNSTVRFLLKLCALLALMYWGIHTGNSMAEGIVIGALAPGAAIFVWWKLIAPKSASWLTDTGRFLVKMAVFGLSALALAAAGQTLVATSFAVVTVLNASFLLGHWAPYERPADYVNSVLPFLLEKTLVGAKT